MSATRSRAFSGPRNACSPAFACSSLFSSCIEPDVSSTATMSAGFRSSCHSVRIRPITFGSGSDRLRVGCVGSAPLAVVIPGPGLAVGSDGR